MGGEWEYCRLGDVAKIQGGFAFKSKDFVESGVPVVKIKNVRKRNVDLSEVDCVSVDLAKKCSNFYVREGDVLISMTGSGINAPASIVGRVARHTGDNRDFIINQRVGRFVVCNDEKLDLRYLYYFFSRAAIQNLLVSIATGSANQVNISGKQIESVEIPLPPIKEQKAIAHILGTLDDKIELNRQMNATLEAMAQALFKSWFVDFAPVIDKALAAGNPIPESLHKRAEARKALGERRKPLPDDIAQHFPDRFVFNEEMGWVPKGWEVETIGKILDLAYGKSLPAKKRIDGNIPVYGSGGISGSHNEKLVEGPGIIVGRKGTVGSLYWVESDYFPIDTVFYVVRKLELPLYWIYQSLQLIDIKSLGADSAVPGVNRNAVYARYFTIPKDIIFKGYLSLIEPTIAKRKEIVAESATLTTLRDTLLPKLLSGQLRIPDAEKLITDT